MQSVKDFIKDNKKIGSKKGLLEVPFADGKSYSFSKPTNKAKILVLDTETTGLSYIKDEIIEIAGVGVEVDRDSFEVTGVKALFDYFNQPSEPISPKITEITGITNEDVEGQSYDLKSISQWIRRCDIILAHNATFDRPFVDKLPHVS